MGYQGIPSRRKMTPSRPSRKAVRMPRRQGQFPPGGAQRATYGVRGELARRPARVENEPLAGNPANFLATCP
jgi:hypothetical protein